VSAAVRLLESYSAYREEATAMRLVGCDLHARKQQVAMLDSETGEVQEVELCHHGEDVERFYAALPRPATVAVESTGYALWFHALMRQLGHTLLVGDAAKIRAMVVRKTKTDRRDALHLLDLLKHDRLPAIWVPDPATRDLRALLAHRMRLVRMRTMVTNGLHAIALSYRLVGGSKQLTRARVAELQRLALPVHTGHRRDESLELLGWLDAHIRQLDNRVAEPADGDPGARQLLTHPGVGAGAALELRRPLGQPLDERDHFLHPLSQLRLGLLRALGEGGLERVLQVGDGDPEHQVQSGR